MLLKYMQNPVQTWEHILQDLEMHYDFMLTIPFSLKLLIQNVFCPVMLF